MYEDSFLKPKAFRPKVGAKLLIKMSVDFTPKRFIIQGPRLDFQIGGPKLFYI